jgi:hypothetical protein
MSDKTPAESIKEAEEMQGKSIKSLDYDGESIYPDNYWNPFKNIDVISIIKQKDGNYKLWGQRFGKMVELRGVKPEDVLGGFLTHE